MGNRRDVFDEVYGIREHENTSDRVEKHEEKKPPRKKRKLRSSIKIGFILMVVGIVFGIAGSLYVVNRFADDEEDNTIITEEHTLTSEEVEHIIQSASDLITTKYRYKDLSTFENHQEFYGNTIPFTTDVIIFTYTGTIGAGIDLSKVKFEINNESKSIVVIIPEVSILTNEVDESSFEFYDVKNSVFTDTSLNDYAKVIAELKEKKQAEVTADTAFMDSVKRNTQNVLKDFLTVSELTKEYTVVFQEKSST